jgi:aminopeptidase
MNELYFSRYADLLVSYALNIQPGQTFYINAEVSHRALCAKMADIAYGKGAKIVHIDLTAPEFLESRLKKSSVEDLEFVPRCVKEKYEEMIDEEAASLRLVGLEDPDLLSQLDPKKSNIQQLHFRKAIQRYYSEGVGQSKVAWTVAAHATPKWGKKIFPHLSEEEAYLKLWDEIYKICRVDTPDYLERWKKHNQVLKKRAKFLDDLKIKTLHFTGPGTDLKVFLSPLSTFRGGGDNSARGVIFEPNIPTEECFTTPDYRLTEGHARVTRPFLVNGKLIENLKITFKNGEITHFSASSGEETFREYISCDEGAKKLGEVALVGIDSPIFQSGHVFQEILFDENAACHIAVGFAYPFCIRGGEKMAPDELLHHGCNRSHCHVDMMISDENVDVTAITQEDKKVPLLVKGSWVI